MEIIILILGLFVALNYAILSYGLSVVDNSGQFSQVDHGVWLIIVFSTIPTIIKFAMVYLRAPKDWFVRIVSSDRPSESKNGKKTISP